MESGSSSSASGSASSAILFEDIFDVEKLNPEGKKFDRVDRVVAKGETYETDLKLDLANELFSLRAGDKITFALASTLRPDGKPDSDYYDPQEGKPSLLDSYDYGMCGKIFKYEHVGERTVNVIASFGGLLMLLAGDQRHLIRLALDQKVYCLVRKIGGGSGAGGVGTGGK